MLDTQILVVDDSPDICEFLKADVLEPIGYQVRTVGDGMSALTLIQEFTPDLVITDHQLPNLTGIEIIKRTRENYPYLPMILITGEGSERLAVDAIRAGASDYITKPFDSDYLLAVVERKLAEAYRWQDLLKDQSEAKKHEQVLKRRLQEIEALTSIGRDVTAMLNLDDVLRSVVDAAVQLTDAEEGSLLLLDEDSGELYMHASKNFDEDFACSFRLHVQDSLAGQVISKGEPVLLDQGSPQKIKTSYLVHALVYVPLNVRERTIGVLGVDNRKAGRSFTTDDIMLLTALGDYAAIAIENARLYDRTEAERRKLETIITQIENGVIVLDPENRILMINQTAREAFGVNGNWQGHSVVEVFENEHLLSLIRASNSTSRREEIELKEGRIFNAQRTPIPVVGQAIVMQDITHLKELDRIKSEFVTTVSHDLRSPLTAILGYVELIERTGSLSDQQRGFIQRVRSSVEQITLLVSDLLDLGRIEAGLDGAKEQLKLGSLVRESAGNITELVEAKGLNLSLDLYDNSLEVLADPIRMRQMIGNLLENAIKYTPDGGAIRLEVETEDDQVILRVKDSGPGIPPVDQPYLFDKFYRASNVCEDTPGTGLGLSIVKSIVDNHDGRIWVESNLGQGAVFTVVLPATVE